MKKGAFLLKNGRLFCNWRYARIDETPEAGEEVRVVFVLKTMKLLETMNFMTQNQLTKTRGLKKMNDFILVYYYDGFHIFQFIYVSHSLVLCLFVFKMADSY